MTLLLSPLVLASCAGGSKVILYPILKSDITRMELGKPYTPEKNGWFLSEEYLRQVVRAEVK